MASINLHAVWDVFMWFSAFSSKLHADCNKFYAANGLCSFICYHIATDYWSLQKMLIQTAL
jgi:hypothetical protein